jgi:hypothetical protein
LDFHALTAPILYFASFAAMFALFVSAVMATAWVLRKLWRAMVRILRRALRE